MFENDLASGYSPSLAIIFPSATDVDAAAAKMRRDEEIGRECRCEGNVGFVDEKERKAGVAAGKPAAAASLISRSGGDICGFGWSCLSTREDRHVVSCVLGIAARMRVMCCLTRLQVRLTKYLMRAS